MSVAHNLKDGGATHKKARHQSAHAMAHAPQRKKNNAQSMKDIIQHMDLTELEKLEISAFLDGSKAHGLNVDVEDIILHIEVQREVRARTEAVIRDERTLKFRSELQQEVDSVLQEVRRAGR